MEIPKRLFSEEEMDIIMNDMGLPSGAKDVALFLLNELKGSELTLQQVSDNNLSQINALVDDMNYLRLHEQACKFIKDHARKFSLDRDRVKWSK